MLERCSLLFAKKPLKKSLLNDLQESFDNDSPRGWESFRNDLDRNERDSLCNDTPARPKPTNRLYTPTNVPASQADKHLYTQTNR